MMRIPASRRTRLEDPLDRCRRFVEPLASIERSDVFGLVPKAVLKTPLFRAIYPRGDLGSGDDAGTVLEAVSHRIASGNNPFPYLYTDPALTGGSVSPFGSHPVRVALRWRCQSLNLKHRTDGTRRTEALMTGSPTPNWQPIAALPSSPR